MQELGHDDSQPVVQLWPDYFYNVGNVGIGNANATHKLYSKRDKTIHLKNSKSKIPNPKVDTRESPGLTSLESKDLEFETWNLGFGISDQNVTIYPICIITPS